MTRKKKQTVAGHGFGNMHIAHATKKANNSFVFLGGNLKSYGIELKKITCITLVRPTLDYCMYNGTGSPSHK